MTLAQLESIFKANIGVGYIEAMEALCLHGYYDGLGATVNAQTPIAGVVASRPAPTFILKIPRPELR
jgi:hypothetical protein